MGGEVGGQGNAGRRNQKLFNGYRFQLLKWKGKERDNGDDVTRCEYLMPLSRTLKTVKRISGKLGPYPLSSMLRGRQVTLTETVLTPGETCMPVGAHRQMCPKEGTGRTPWSCGKGSKGA